MGNKLIELEDLGVVLRQYLRYLYLDYGSMCGIFSGVTDLRGLIDRLVSNTELFLVDDDDLGCAILDLFDKLGIKYRMKKVTYYKGYKVPTLMRISKLISTHRYIRGRSVYLCVHDKEVLIRVGISEVGKNLSHYNKDVVSYKCIGLHSINLLLNIHLMVDRDIILAS